jgi:hypothetical protein
MQECMQANSSKEAEPGQETQARTDQKRHLGKQESRLAGRKRHVCKTSQVKTTRHMWGDRHAAMQTAADN